MTTFNRIIHSFLSSFLTLAALFVLSLGSLRTMGCLFGTFLEFRGDRLLADGQPSLTFTA